MKKACKTCKMLVDEKKAANNQRCGCASPGKLTESWKGRVIVFDAEKSLWAKSLKTTFRIVIDSS